MLVNSAIIAAIVAVLISFILNFWQIYFFSKKENKRKDLEYFFKKLEELDSFCFDYWCKGNSKNILLVAAKLRHRIFLFVSLLQNIEKKYKGKNYMMIQDLLEKLQDSATGGNFDGKYHKKNPEIYLKITANISSLRRNMLKYIW